MDKEQLATGCVVIALLCMGFFVYRSYQEPLEISMLKQIGNSSEYCFENKCRCIAVGKNLGKHAINCKNASAEMEELNKKLKNYDFLVK